MKNLKIPIHDYIVEQFALGRFMDYNEELDNTTLSEEDFYNDFHKKLFVFMINLRMNGRLFDAGILHSYLIIKAPKEYEAFGGVQALFGIQNPPCVKILPIENRQKRLKEFTALRKLNLSSRKMQDLLDKETDLNELLAGISKNTKEMLEVSKDSDGNVDKGFEEFEEIKRLKGERGMLGIASKYPVLDRYTEGYIEGATYTILAFSNTGKTRFANSLVCDFLKKGLDVMYISLEVGDGQLMRQLLCCYYSKTNVEANNLIYNKEHFKNLKIFSDVYDLTNIVSLIRQKRPKFVVLDYIQLVRAKGKDDYTKLTETIEELQRVMKEINGILINLSQVSNESISKPIEDLIAKGSGAITACSDVVFALKKDGGALYLSINKNKFGPAFKKFIITPNFEKSEFSLIELTEKEPN